MIDALALAWRAVRRRRLGSLLAAAGVAIGVCACVSIMSAERSWRKAVTDFFSTMDLETVCVRIPLGVDWRGAGRSKPTLELEDVEAILAHCAAVDSATLVTSGGLRAETMTGGALGLSVYAVDADFMETLPDETREGRWFTTEEFAGQSPVCVLSYQARFWLFGSKDAVGQDIRVGGHRFKVVGVIAGNRHVDIIPRALYVPATWSRSLLQVQRRFMRRTAIYAHTENPKAALSQIEDCMRQRIGGGGLLPFADSLWQVREMAFNARTRATLYSGLAGFCALLAGGIGIAALLFVSVAEQSREIGIHRAVGATRGHIYGVYLLAAVILSLGGALLGGLAGIPAAAAGSFSTRWQPVLDPLAGEMLVERPGGLPDPAEIALSVSWDALAISVALSLLIGVAAALAPASEAASVNPVLAINQRAGGKREMRRWLTCLQIGLGVLALVVLTSSFSALQTQEKAEARKTLGEDRVSAVVDPIGAMRKPVEPSYVSECDDAFAQVLASPECLVSLRKQTPLLTDLFPSIVRFLPVKWGGRVVEAAQVLFTTEEAFAYEPELRSEDRARMARAFREGSAVAVISPETQKDLFDDREALGESISILRKEFTVIAVRPNPRLFSGSSRVWVPVAFYDTLRHRSPFTSGQAPTVPTRVEARPIDERRYVEAMTQLRDALLPMLPEQYRQGIKLSEQIPETTKQFIFQHKAMAVRGAVGASAVLLVALIGLANMLLVSVHQEMRETGIRRALGAQRSDIILHYLSEGVTLSALGSAGGLAAGFLVCWATRNWSGLPISVSAFWGVAGAVAAVVAGMIVSLFPAVISARANPAETFRYE